MVSKRLAGFLPYLWGLFLWVIFLPFQAQGISGGDSGDLVTAAWLGGVPHPPGYPLYTLMGFAVSHLPVISPAWTMAILSSLPHAAAAAIAGLLVWQISGMAVAGMFASLVLTGNYLFFLYSTTPEVFALLDFFIVVLVYLCYRWTETKKPHYLLWLSFMFGLSVTHHLVIFFLLPALGYWLLRGPKPPKWLFPRALGYGVLGLLPYLYIPIAARGNSIINWDRAIDLTGFIRLVTRADYGTFVSSGFYGSGLTDRLIQLKLYGQFILFDVRWVGIILAALGWYWLWREKRVLAYGLMMAFASLGPLFFFYASFPLVNRFTVGTYERFLLPSYLIIAILIGLGVAATVRWLQRLPGIRLANTALFRIALVSILFLYPFMTGGVTLWRFWGLSSDKTAENLARDILVSVPPQAIVLLERDTPLFTTQYVRYVLRVRPDIKLIHSSLLPLRSYPDVIQSVFSEISVPLVRGSSFASQFIGGNSGKFPIVSITRLPIPSGFVWVPHGLVFLLEPTQNVESVEAMIATNRALWSGYHDPSKGILGRYNHLLLSDVRDVYMTGRIELGKTLVRAGKTLEAKAEFEAAVNLGGDALLSNSYVYLGLSELFLKNCDAALTAFTRARETSAVAQPTITLYEASTYRDCLGNAGRATELFAKFEAEQQKQETPLGAP